MFVSSHPLRGPADGGSRRGRGSRPSRRLGFGPRGPLLRKDCRRRRARRRPRGRPSRAGRRRHLGPRRRRRAPSGRSADGRRADRARARRRGSLPLAPPAGRGQPRAGLPGAHRRRPRWARDPPDRLGAPTVPVAATRGGPDGCLPHRSRDRCGDRGLPVRAPDGGGGGDGLRSGARRGSGLPRPGLGRCRDPGLARGVLRGQLRGPGPVQGSI